MLFLVGTRTSLCTNYGPHNMHIWTGDLPRQKLRWKAAKAAKAKAQEASGELQQVFYSSKLFDAWVQTVLLIHAPMPCKIGFDGTCTDLAIMSYML